METFNISITSNDSEILSDISKSNHSASSNDSEILSDISTSNHSTSSNDSKYSSSKKKNDRIVVLKERLWLWLCPLDTCNHGELTNTEEDENKSICTTSLNSVNTILSKNASTVSKISRATIESIYSFIGKPWYPHSSFKNILVVDDSIIQCRMAIKCLEINGFQMDKALSGSIALTLMKEHAYNIVLIDINMPFLDGFETVRRLKILHKKIFLKTLIIGMSADIKDDTSEKSIENGMDCFLSKPLTMKKLNRFISEFSNVYDLPAP